VRRLLTLEGDMAPHQIITLMHIDGAPTTLAMADHANHIHIGWRPRGGQAVGGTSLTEPALDSEQWTRLIGRLRRLGAPLYRSNAAGRRD
jgi:hypothetical protein